MEHQLVRALHSVSSQSMVTAWNRMRKSLRHCKSFIGKMNGNVCEIRLFCHPEKSHHIDQIDWIIRPEIGLIFVFFSRCFYLPQKPFLWVRASVLYINVDQLTGCVNWIYRCHHETSFDGTQCSYRELRNVWQTQRNHVTNLQIKLWIQANCKRRWMISQTWIGVWTSCYTTYLQNGKEKKAHFELEYLCSTMLKTNSIINGI